MSLCKNTKIKLRHEESKTFEELAKFEDFLVLSINENLYLEYCKTHSIKLTEKNAKLIEVVLSNNEKVRCTPDHKFMLKDGSHKEAKDLTDELLMSFKESFKQEKVYVSNVNEIEIREDVYCLTVDKFHNFALDSKIFVSSV